MKELSLKYNELSSLLGAMRKLRNVKKTSFAIILEKNISKMTAIVNKLDGDLLAMQEKRECEYENKRKNLCVQYSEKNGGTPIIENNNFVIQKGKDEEFKAKVGELQSLYPEQYETCRLINNEMAEKMNKKYNVVLHGFCEKDLPDDLSANEISEIIDLILT